MEKNVAINNFSAGEWTPFLDGRTDLAKYGSACTKLENFRPLPWGGATFRSGTLQFGLAKNGGSPCRLIPFNYSTALSFVIELGNQYLRIWQSNGTPVTTTATVLWVSGSPYVVGNYVQDPGDSNNTYYCIANVSGPTQPHSDGSHWSKQTILEIPTPYFPAQIRQVHVRQINAQMRMTISGVTPYTLTYLGGNSWTFIPTVFKYPVLMDQNSAQSLKLSLSSITQGGSATMTASAPTWLTGTYYIPRTYVLNSGSLYVCQVAHTSGTFNTDLFNGLWQLVTFFNSSHVGSQWEIQTLNPASSVLVDMNNQSVGVPFHSASVIVQGAWNFTTSQFWWGTVSVDRSIDGGTTWVVIRTFSAKSDQNYATSGTEPAPTIGAPQVLYRITYTQAGAPFAGSIWVGAAPSQYSYAQASLVVQSAYVAGVVTVTSYVDPLDVFVTINLAPLSGAASYLWSEGAFSAYRGFPATIGFYEQRLLYSGTAAQPNRVWGSVTGDFDNFQYSSNDDGAVAFQPAVCQQNQVGWIGTILRIHLGTSGEEILMASGNLDEALTPSNVTMRAQSFYGSAAFQPLLLSNSILFVERNGLRIREMRELSPYVVPTDFIAPDLTLLSEHILGPGLFQMDFGRLPDPLCYFVRSDGQMAVLTYNREQNITSWGRYTTQGNFESVACIYGAPADVVWVSVKRHLNGVDVRSIEAFTVDPASFPNIQTNMLLDCGAQFLGGIGFIPGATQLVAALPNMKNTVVTAVIDGAEYVGLTVDNNGTLTFPPNVTATNAVNVGLPYVGQISPMKPEMESQEGASQGRKRRIKEIVLRVRNSVSVEFAGGDNPTTFNECQFRSTLDALGSMTPLGGPAGNVNGIVDIPLPGPWPEGNDFSGKITLQQQHPFPLTILGVFTKFAVLD